MDPEDGDASLSEAGTLTVFYWYDWYDEPDDEDAGAWWLHDDYEGPTEEP